MAGDGAGENRRETLLAELAELEASAAEEVQEAVEDAHDAVGETADTAVEVAQEAADTVTEAVEDAAETLAETTGIDVDAAYDEIMRRLEASGRLVAQVSEDGAEHVAEVTPDIVTPIVESVDAALPGDEIHPRSEHPYFKRRRFLGREW